MITKNANLNQNRVLKLDVYCQNIVILTIIRVQMESSSLRPKKYKSKNKKKNKCNLKNNKAHITVIHEKENLLQSAQ